MNYMLRLAFILIVFASCKSTSLLPNQSEQQRVATTEEYQVLVQFKKPEGIKRMLVRLEQFQLEIIKEVSTSSNLFMLQLDAKPYEIDGVIEKMGLDLDVSWAKKVVD